MNAPTPADRRKSHSAASAGPTLPPKYTMAIAGSSGISQIRLCLKVEIAAKIGRTAQQIVPPLHHIQSLPLLNGLATLLMRAIQKRTATTTSHIPNVNRSTFICYFDRLNRHLVAPGGRGDKCIELPAVWTPRFHLAFYRACIRSPYDRLCLEASYRIMAAAIAEFKDSTVPLCGIRSTLSQVANSFGSRPCPSFPIKIAEGLRQSHCSIVSAALGEVPMRPILRERKSETVSSRGSDPIWGKRNTLPALARTTLPL